MMNEVINKELKDIEDKENVRIIYACESGSRAWGFESSDSDYDVRFIYVRNEKEYLKLNQNRDVIEWKLDEVLDINGWDITKALILLKDSNPTLLEWLNSPIVYKECDYSLELRELANNYFSMKKSLYHYLSMAKRNYKEHCLDEIVKLKKYFYVLRPILAAKWIIDKESNPPVLFETLLNEYSDSELKEEVNNLILKKRDMDESDYINKNLILDEYINKEITSLEEKANDVLANETSWDDLNEYFYKVIKK